MGQMIAFRDEVSDEVETILSPEFKIEVTETNSVPHSSDQAITFPNLDAKTQGTKVLETTVLYVDMRRSTELSLKHRRHTVAKLYSAFVRSMTRCAGYFGGEVRGIIGDRVLILFQPDKCFENAIDTAELMNSVCQYVLNKHFIQDEVEFGFGIDYGRMLATKTGIRRHGEAQSSYRSLVWLGRPANVASKLTDLANKPKETTTVEMVRVAHNTAAGLVYREDAPHLFVQRFTHNPTSGLMIHADQTFHSFSHFSKTIETRAATPSILMTKSVYDGFRLARPNAIEILNGWIKPASVVVSGYKGGVYGTDVIYTTFRQ
jgi:adenylate cyclase